MELINFIYNIALIGLMAAGLGSVIYTLPKVASWWTPVYWMALPVPTLTLVLVLEEVIFHGLFSATTTLIVLQVIFFLLGLLFIVVPWVHRVEKETLNLEAGLDQQALIERIKENDE